MLPQVLAGLGVASLVNGACLFWLRRLQPIFFAVAIGAILYEVILITRHQPALRKRGTKAMLAASLMLNLVVAGGWVLLSIRYR